MQCFCENKKTSYVKVEGDVGADPLWCYECGCNLDIEEVPVSSDLKDQLMSWAMLYGEWIDWNVDRLLPDGLELEKKHNERGQLLTEKVKTELGTTYTVRFSPSSSAKSYAKAGLKL